MAIDVIAGIADGCIEADCALMVANCRNAGLYPAGTYDLAGILYWSCRAELYCLEPTKVGDIAMLFGPLASIPMVFHLFEKLSKIRVSLDSSAPFESDADHLGAVLMTPTNISKGSCYRFDHRRSYGIIYVTGGGLIGVTGFGDTVSFRLDCTAMPLPPVFSWIK